MSMESLRHTLLAIFFACQVRLNCSKGNPVVLILLQVNSHLTKTCKITSMILGKPNSFP
jgi:hypothetical protein